MDYAKRRQLGEMLAATIVSSRPRADEDVLADVRKAAELLKPPPRIVEEVRSLARSYGVTL